jgi:nucleotide-binding universal stress UspA family protein
VLVRGTVVCAVGDTHAGLAALELAAELSDRLGLRLVLVRVGQAIDDPATSGARSPGLLRARFAADRGLAQRTELREAVGASAVHLGWIAADEAADLIVLGSTRRRWLRGGFECRLAETLAYETPVPIVIAVPRPRRSWLGGGRPEAITSR